MYVMQNAFRNVLRNRGRNILIGVIISVIIISTVVGLMINNTTSGIIDDYKTRFAAEVSFVANMQKMRESVMANYTGGRVTMSAPIISPEHYVEFGRSEYLQSAVYTASVGVNSDDIAAIESEKGGGGASGGVMIVGGVASYPTAYMMRLLNQFDDFQTGLRDIAEGRMPENRDEIIISADLAELNGISVGDTMSFNSELSEGGMSDRKTIDIHYDLTVVGTYYDATDEYPANVQQNAYTNRRNEILTGYETVVAPMQPGLRGININATFYLKNPELLDAFATEAYAKGLDPVFDVTTDGAGYNKIVGPVEGLKSISTTFMVIVLVFGGAVIALLSSIAIRERKYEIGVLRAMGMKKYKVALGLWSEMLILTGFCLVVGLGAGTLLAQPVANGLLERQIEAAGTAAAPSQPFPSGGMAMMGGASVFNPSANVNVEPLMNIDISLGIDTTLQIIGISLLLASIAGLASVSRITKYEPITILMERS
jgi:putative ABC transport system permease protein